MYSSLWTMEHTAAVNLHGTTDQYVDVLRWNYEDIGGVCEKRESGQPLARGYGGMCEYAALTVLLTSTPLGIDEVKCEDVGAARCL